MSGGKKRKARPAEATGGRGDTPRNKVTTTAVLAAMERGGCLEGNLQCALTGRRLTPQTVSVDHIVPLSGGGEHSMENLQFVCTEANRAKGTMSQADFVALCCEVADYHRGTSGHTQH